MGRRKLRPRTVRRQVKAVSEPVNDSHDPLSDPRVLSIVMDAFIQGTRIAKGHRISPELAAMLAPLIDEDGVAFDHSVLEPPRRRGRPRRYASIPGKDHPDFYRMLDDIFINAEFHMILEVLRSQPIKRLKDEAFDGWVNRLLPIARKAWESFARDGIEPPIWGTPRSYRKEPFAAGPVPLSDERLRTLVTLAIGRGQRRRERRRDADRSRLAYRLLAHRWDVTPGFIRSRIQAARQMFSK